MIPVRDVRRGLDWVPAKVKAYRGRPAQLEDCPELVDKSVVLREGGKVSIVYLNLSEYGHDLSGLAEALTHVDFNPHFRTSGMPVTSRTFGFSPRIAMRQDYCTAAMLATESPHAHDELCKAARVAETFYAEHNPTLHKRHREVTAMKVLAQYHLENGVFTSGIVNSANLLPYHFDSGNFEDVWSAMLVFKRSCEGGFLAVPQYGMAFALPDHSLFMFDGQGLLHGVTPFTLGPGGYRYSVVYYTLKGMWQCETTDKEVARVQEAMWRRARKRAEPD